MINCNCNKRRASLNQRRARARAYIADSSFSEDQKKYATEYMDYLASLVNQLPTRVVNVVVVCGTEKVRVYVDNLMFGPIGD